MILRQGLCGSSEVPGAGSQGAAGPSGSLLPDAPLMAPPLLPCLLPPPCVLLGSALVDSTPQFLSPDSAFKLPVGTVP